MKNFYAVTSGILILISLIIIRPVHAANVLSKQETKNNRKDNSNVVTTIKQNPLVAAPVNKNGSKKLRYVSQISISTPSYPVGIKSNETILVPYSLDEMGNVSGDITSRTFQFFTQYDVPLSEVVGPYPASIDVRALQRTEWNELVH